MGLVNLQHRKKNYTKHTILSDIYKSLIINDNKKKERCRRRKKEIKFHQLIICYKIYLNVYHVDY